MSFWPSLPIGGGGFFLRLNQQFPKIYVQPLDYTYIIWYNK